MNYFGFALADSMFRGNGTIVRTAVSPEYVRENMVELIPCLNPSHVATINAMRGRFGIDLAIPEVPPRVELQHDDTVIVMGVRGLPRLTDRHEYTTEEIESATFSFTLYRFWE